jgi:1-acyl-sn-glycerol-3-phosphate acyltransferase
MNEKVRPVDQGPVSVRTGTPARSNPLLALFRGVLVALATGYDLSGVLIQRGLTSGSSQKRDVTLKWEQSWLRHFAQIMGIHVETQGEPPEAGSCLVPNHVGYVDIIALGSAVPTFFVAKAAVESWPVIGFLFKLSGQISIHRQNRRGVAIANHQIAERLSDGQSVCVFLEGTSSGGDGVLPFKPSLVQPAIDSQSVLVPVGITWHSKNEEIVPREDIAYWKDHVLMPHLFRLLGLRDISVTIRFGKPVKPNDDRKALANKLHTHVTQLRES